MSAVTQTNTGRVVLIAVAALMIAALAVFGPPSYADVVVETDAGVIILSTGPDPGDNWIRYYEETENFDINIPSKSQSIAVDRCGVTTSGTILSISQDGGRRGLGLVSNGFGTRDKNNCATGNGQIAVDESVTLTLGSDFSETFGISAAEIDIEGKQNAKLSYVAGSNTGERDINSASDNGPDSGTADNEIIDFDFSAAPASSITLSPSGNSKALISVEGGGDGLLEQPIGSVRHELDVNQTVLSISSTKVYDGELDCGESATATDGTGTGSDGPAVDSTLARALTNTKGDCTLVPYTFEIQDDNVFFDYEDTGEGARFLVRIDWNPGVDPIDPPVRQVDLGDGIYSDGTACDSVTTPPGENEPSVEDGYSHATEPVCLASQKFVLDSNDEWQQIQWWAVNADPRWK